MQTTSNPLVLGSTDRRVERLLKNINLHPSVPSDLNHAAISNSFLSKTVVQDVWRQQALLQLLQVAEISMLDCILSSPAKPEPLRSSHRNHGDPVISNTRVDREVSERKKIILFRFCQEVSLQQYEENKDKATLHSLKQLMHHMAHSDGLSVKQKRRLAKQFQKHHPGVFLQHLSSSF